MTATTFDPGPVVAALVTIDEQIEELEQRRASLRQVLADNLPLGTRDVNGHKVTVATSRRLDPRRFADRYPAGDYPHLWESKPSTKAIKEHLAPVDVADCYVESSPYVKLA